MNFFDMLTEPLTVSPFQALSEVQSTAFDLYRRGLNIFPVPCPKEVRVWARLTGEDPLSKPPYLAEPLFYARLHVCGFECEQRKKRTGHPCLRYEEQFMNLFVHANLAVMTGRTSGNLLSIDCDSQKAFETILAEFDRRNLPHWAYSSHRGGGLLVRLAEGEAANLQESSVPDVQVWGNRHYVILPPSIHGLGTVYQWVTPEPLYNLPEGQHVPEVSVKTLDWLGVMLARGKGRQWEEPELYGLPAWTVNLSRNNRRILVTTFEKGARNVNLCKPTYDIAALINAGTIPYSEGEQVLIKAARLSNYPDGEIKAMLKSAVKKNPVPARKGGSCVPKAWQKAQAFAQSYDWRGILGRIAITARATFEACIERARMDNNETFRATERELSEMANFGNHKRARRGLSLLVSIGLLERVGKGQGGSNLYAFGKPVIMAGGHNNDPTIPPIVVNSGVKSVPPDNAEKDVFFRLGQVAHRVWHHLCETPEPSLKAIARVTHQAETSVSDAVKKRLIPNRLVIHNPVDGLYYGETKSNLELGLLATNLGTLGRSEKRKRDHQSERERRLNQRMAHARSVWMMRYAEMQ